MTTTRRTTVVGVFEDRRQAERAVQELCQAGFAREQIGFAARGPAGEKVENAAGDAAYAAAGGATGAVAGGLFGGLLGALVTAFIPGVGPAVTAGLLATIVGSAFAGGLAGALLTMGIPEEEAKFYQQEFEAGRPIVTVRANDRYSEALAILSANGAYDATRQEAATGARQ